MPIFKKLIKRNNKKDSSELDNALEEIIGKIEASKDNQSLDDFFISIGEKLLKYGANSAVCILDEEKNNFTVKHLSLAKEYKKFLSDAPLPEIALAHFPELEKSIKNKSAIPADKIIDKLKTLLPVLAESDSIAIKQCCIIAPLVIQNDVIGFLAVMSPCLKPANLPALESFAQKIVFLLTSKVLYQEIKRSEQRYEELWDQAPIAYHTLDAKGVIKEVNSMGAKLLGYAKEEMVGRPIFDFILPQQQADAKRRFKLKLEGKSMERKKDRVYVKKDGEKIFVSVKDAFEKDAQGKIVSIRTTILDYTKRRNMEKALKESVDQIRQSQKNLKQIIDTIQNGICVIDKNRRITNCNKTFRDSVGLPMEKILDQPCNKIVPLYGKGVFKNHCVRRICDKKCGAEQVFNTGEIIDYTDINEDEKGDKHYHKINIFPAKDRNDSIYQAVMTISDITKQARVESEYKRLSEFNKNILNSAPISIVALDKNGIIITANKLAKELMDKPHRQIIGRRLCDTEGIKKNPDLLKLYDNLLNKGEPFFYDNLSYTADPLGRKKYLNIIAVPLSGSNNRINGAISMAINNTEEVLAKQNLEELNRNLEKIVSERTRELDLTNKKLREAIELKSKFIADASHELRTPLTVIQGNLDLAIREAESQNCKIPEAYDHILSEVKRMTGVLSDLTVLANTDSNTERLHMGKINLGKVMKAVGQSLKILAEQKKISLIYKQGAKNIQIFADEDKVEKLLLNILRNAIKYSENKGKIKMWADTEGDYARIHIQDNGIGIPKEDLPYIFERFYRVDKARSRAEGGTGLGLSICRWIAEAHNGHIKVASELGKGSTFTVYLPFDQNKKAE